MKIEEYKSIKEISDLWNKIYINNSNMSWFQSYNWNESLEKKFEGRKHTRYRKCRLLYVVLDTRFIAPLVIHEKNKTISILGK